MAKLLCYFLQETNGTYGVALDEHHLQELVMSHAPPPPTPASATAASMVGCRVQKGCPLPS